MNQRPINPDRNLIKSNLFARLLPLLLLVIWTADVFGKALICCFCIRSIVLLLNVVSFERIFALLWHDQWVGYMMRGSSVAHCLFTIFGAFYCMEELHFTLAWLPDHKKAMAALYFSQSWNYGLWGTYGLYRKNYRIHLACATPTDQSNWQKVWMRSTGCAATRTLHIHQWYLSWAWWSAGPVYSAAECSSSWHGLPRPPLWPSDPPLRPGSDHPPVVILGHHSLLSDNATTTYPIRIHTSTGLQLSLINIHVQRVSCL